MAVKRSSYLSLRDPVNLRKGRAVKIWGYDPDGRFACRLEISAAGIEVYAGEKGGKKLYAVNWERLVEDLNKLSRK